MIEIVREFVCTLKNANLSFIRLCKQIYIPQNIEYQQDDISVPKTGDSIIVQFIPSIVS